MTNIKQLLVKSFSFLFHLLDKIAFKKNIIFACRGGNDYADNSKYLFEEFIKNKHKDIFFYTKSKKTLSKIPKGYGIYAYSLRTMFILLRSKTLIFTHGSGDFSPYIIPTNKNRTFLNLFHAIAVKKVGHRGVEKSILEAKKWDYFVVSSDFEAAFIKDQYTLDDHQILTFGQPRNDTLCVQESAQVNKEKKVILYAPTFRDTGNTELFPFADLDLEQLDTYLGTIDTKIMIRLHINDEKRYKNQSKYNHLQNIFFAGSDIHPSVNDILHTIDAVISDYSSIVIDFLLLNKPIAYIPYDYEKYKTERGFSFDYFEHSAGDIIESQSDLESFLRFETDHFKEKRLLLKNIFHKHQNGKSAKRLYDYIIRQQ